MTAPADSGLLEPVPDNVGVSQPLPLGGSPQPHN